jgi:acetylxylan esterase
VRSAYPGYSGPRPRIQLYHGTADTLLYPQNFFEEIKEWTNVFGYPQTPVSNTSIPGYPSTYSNATFGGPQLQAILAQGVGHYVPVAENLILQFFNIA